MNKETSTQEESDSFLLLEAIASSYAQNMARSVDIVEAEKSLSKLADEVASGQEITVSKDGLPIMKLVPLTVSAAKSLSSGKREFKLGYAREHLKDFSWEEWEQSDIELERIFKHFGHM